MALARATLFFKTFKQSACLRSPTLQRAMTIEIDKFKDKETAEEAVFMSKQDEKLLRNILKKVKQQADAKDKHSAVGESAADKSSLKEILAKYNVSETDLDALIQWKHSS